MFGQLAAKGADAFGKAFIFNGVLPALVAVLGVWLLYAGAGNIILETNELLAGKEPAALTWRAIGILGLSLVFMVLRETAVSFLEDLPGGLLKPLRSRLEVKAQLQRRFDEDCIAVREMEYSALRWLNDGETGKIFISSCVPVSSWRDAEAAAGNALARAYRNSGLAEGGPRAVHLNDVVAIRAGLLALFAFHARNPNSKEATAALQLWQAWRSGTPIATKATLDLAIAATQREIGAMEARLARFPEPRWIKPTHLGNLFSALQDYAEKRYRISTALLWEHVWWSLPEGAKKEIGTTRMLIESIVTLSLVFGALAGVGVLFLLLKAVPAGWWDGLPHPSAWHLALASLLLAILSRGSYLLALVPGHSFMRQVMSLIDVYRLQMLKEVGLVPKTVQEELDILGELHAFWSAGMERKPTRELTPKEKEKSAPEAKPSEAEGAVSSPS